MYCHLRSSYQKGMVTIPLTGLAMQYIWIWIPMSNDIAFQRDEEYNLILLGDIDWLGLWGLLHFLL
jgi:hypothetical protein